MPPPPDATTWLRSDRFLARSVAQPVERFLHIEASGGILLVAAAVVALVWANSPWSQSYVDLFHTEISIAVGGHCWRRTSSTGSTTASWRCSSSSSAWRSSRSWSPAS